MNQLAPTVEISGLHHVVGFHVRDGWFFRRLDGGQVHVYHVPGPSVGVHPPVVHVEITMQPEEWASVMASVSHRGETLETWKEALSFHQEDARGSRSEVEEALRELVRAVQAERFWYVVDCGPGRDAVGLDSWDGMRNLYGDEFRADRVVAKRSLALQNALSEAKRVLGQLAEGDDREISEEAGGG